MAVSFPPLLLSSSSLFAVDGHHHSRRRLFQYTVLVSCVYDGMGW